MKTAFELDQGVAEVIRRIEEQLTTAARPVIVGVAGGSASGKTSQVARRLKDYFGLQAAAMAMDNYYRGQQALAELRATGLAVTWDEPAAIDLTLLHDHLLALRSGRSISQPVYDFTTSESNGFVTVAPRDLIIVEGLFVLHPQLRPLIDLKIFVDIGLHGRIIRRLLRDVVRTTMPPAAIVDYFSTVVEPMHQQHVVSTKEQADIVIVNEYRPYIEAHRTGMLSRQYKYRGWVTPDQLHRLPAERLATVRQTDTYYHPADHDLRQSDEILRIRQEGPEFTLAYKGPKIRPEANIRPVIEFGITPEIAARFVSVYGHSVTTVTKERTIYLMASGIITLDQVDRVESGQVRALGRFTEIRLSESTVSDEELSSMCQRLGLNPDEAILASYHQL